jgi:hypothetical protein
MQFLGNFGPKISKMLYKVVPKKLRFKVNYIDTLFFDL